MRGGITEEMGRTGPFAFFAELDRVSPFIG